MYATDVDYDIIGLDLSLTSTGISTANGEDAIATKLKGMERLDRIKADIMSVLWPFERPYVVIEGYAFAKKTSHAFAQGELGGIIKMELFDEGIPFVNVPPTVRAKFATGRGNAGKSEVVSTISAKTGVVFTGSGSDDMVDAWVLREMGLCHFGKGEHKWNQRNLEALESVEWI